MRLSAHFTTLPLLLLVVLMHSQHSLGEDKEECLCRGENVELVGEHAWLESGDYGFEPNATCAEIEKVFANLDSCPDPGEIRELCCIDHDRPLYVCSKTVRNTILNDYDKLSTPAASALHDRVNVTIKVEYHSVTDINIEAGTAEIFVWLTLSWRDARLAWTYDPNTTCTTFPITVRASMGVSGSDIWVPDLELLNRVSGTKNMGSSLAAINPDGTVVWQRDGKLKAICNLKNLGNIPFDELGCQFMFASVSSQEFGIDYMLDPNGALVVGNFSSPYAEYSLVRAHPGIRTAIYSGIEVQTLFFDFYFGRGTTYYIHSIILPVIIFSALSICSITLGFSSQQRIGLNLTLLLVAVAQKIAMAKLLPVTDHKIWLVNFVTYSFFWNVSTLFENIFVATVVSIREAYGKEEEEAAEQMLGQLELDQETELHRPQGLPTTACASSDVGASSDKTTVPTESKSFLPAWFFTFSLRRFDAVCFVLSLTSYVVFIVIMMTSRGSWGNDVSNEFLWSNSTTTGHYE